MLLLITGSGDGSSDLIVSRLGRQVFRFNYDLFADYKLSFSPQQWEIENPAGLKISSRTATSVFWWKAFNFYLLDQEPFIVEEVKYIFRELYHWCRKRGLTKGNPHDYHNHMGKMNILSIADSFFKTPQTLATFGLHGAEQLGHRPVVTKSFTSGLTTTNKTLFTTQVDLEKLDPRYPWFLQELIVSKADITVFVCGERLFAFERSRLELKGLDWRKEQAFERTDSSEWKLFNLSAQVEKNIKSFLNQMGVDWGRIDFMLHEDDLIFLEFNANGQWVFLDYENKFGLLDAVIDYLCRDRRAVCER